MLIRFRRPWRNGTEGVRLAPAVFILRLASLLFPPRVNLTRYHGVFAPSSPLRSRVVPAKKGIPPRAGRWARWSDLILRVFGRDPTACPRCGRTMERIAALHGRGRAWAVLGWIEKQGTIASYKPG